MKFLSPQLYIKSTSDSGHIEGYASVFNKKDEQGETVAAGAFKKSIENAIKTGKMPKMLWQHDAKKPIGVWESIEEDAHGLYVKGKLLLELKHGREAWSLLQNKAIDGLSIGYRSPRKTVTNASNLLTEIDLLEISIVTFPACAEATIETVKNADLDKDTSFANVCYNSKLDTNNSSKKNEELEAQANNNSADKTTFDTTKNNKDIQVSKAEKSENKLETKNISDDNLDNLEEKTTLEQYVEYFVDLIKVLSKLTKIVQQFIK